MLMAPSGHSPRQAPRPSHTISLIKHALPLLISNAPSGQFGIQRPQPLHFSSSILITFLLAILVSLPGTYALAALCKGSALFIPMSLIQVNNRCALGIIFAQKVSHFRRGRENPECRKKHLGFRNAPEYAKMVEKALQISRQQVTAPGEHAEPRDYSLENPFREVFFSL